MDKKKKGGGMDRIRSGERKEIAGAWGTITSTTAERGV